jgi:hypothetical protein
MLQGGVAAFPGRFFPNEVPASGRVPFLYIKNKLHGELIWVQMYSAVQIV